MNFKRDVFTKCVLLKRNILFWIVYVFDFFVLALCEKRIYLLQRVMEDVFTGAFLNKYI